MHSNTGYTDNYEAKVKGGMIIQTEIRKERKPPSYFLAMGEWMWFFSTPMHTHAAADLYLDAVCISSPPRKAFQFGSEPYIPKGSSRGNFPPQCISHNSVLCHCFVFGLTNSNLIVDVVHMWQLQFKSNIKCHIQLGKLPSPQSLVMHWTEGLVKIFGRKSANPHGGNWVKTWLHTNFESSWSDFYHANRAPKVQIL